MRDVELLACGVDGQVARLCRKRVNGSKPRAKASAVNCLPMEVKCQELHSCPIANASRRLGPPQRAKARRIGRLSGQNPTLSGTPCSWGRTNEAKITLEVGVPDELLQAFLQQLVLKPGHKPLCLGSHHLILGFPGLTLAKSELHSLIVRKMFFLWLTYLRDA